MALVGCYSNNCPVDNLVTCNYYFYDSEGNSLKKDAEITVSAILPGVKTVYEYRKLGSITITSDEIKDNLVQEGYVQTELTVRKDTILINKASGKQYLEIPMSYFNQADTLLFSYSNITSKDTIIIEHDSYPHVDLPECGSFRYHNLKSIRATDKAIDHVEIVNSTVNYDHNENIKIYFNEVSTDEE